MTSSVALQPRLFKTTGVRVNPRVVWVEVEAKSVLNRVRGMPFQWSINPYRGCEHQCSFCYARRTHWFLDQDGVNNWGNRIFVKINAPEILRRELAHPSWAHEELEVGTATDPYQPAEGAYKITRRILEALRDYRTPVGLITRSSMIVRDLDVLRELARGPGVRVCFSVATMDERVAREIEPGAPAPVKRLEALRTLSRAGIPTVIMLAPVLPGITDDVRTLTEVVTAAREYGAASLATVTLHLGEITRDAFFEFLTHRYPQLVPEYRRLYRGKYAPPVYRRQVQRVVAAIQARVGLRSREIPAAGPATVTEQPPKQLELFGRRTAWRLPAGSSSTATRPTVGGTGPATASCPL